MEIIRELKAASGQKQTQVNDMGPINGQMSQILEIMQRQEGRLKSLEAALASQQG